VKYGYARVSTFEQNLGYQVKRLKEYGCDEVVTDKKTGINARREGLQNILAHIQPGDVVVTLRIDRIARNVRDLLDIIRTLEENQAGLVILDMSGNMVDTTTPMGRFLVTLLGAIAELEYGTLKVKQREGIELAKRQGKYHGRPPKYTANNPKLLHAVELYKAGKTAREIDQITGVSRSTLYRKLAELDLAR